MYINRVMEYHTHITCCTPIHLLTGNNSGIQFCFCFLNWPLLWSAGSERAHQEVEFCCFLFLTELLCSQREGYIATCRAIRGPTWEGLMGAHRGGKPTQPGHGRSKTAFWKMERA